MLGILATILVAWGSALWSPVFSTIQSRTGFGVPHEVRSKVPKEWVGPSAGSSSHTEVLYDCNQGGGLTIWICAVEDTSPFAMTMPSRDLQDVRAGWPFDALGCVIICDLSAATGQVSKDGVRAPQWLSPRERFSNVLLRLSSTGSGPDCFIPLQPIFLGFIANTLIYGLAALAAILAPGLLLGQVRVWRGRCPHCGYDRRGLVGGAKCPECGTPPACG
jgi:hypothetical protein